MTPADLERLAEACECAAEPCRWASRMAYGSAQTPNEPKDACKTLLTLARAIRAGRVTVKEEANG